MINTAKRRILKGRSAHRATVGVAFAYVTDLITRLRLWIFVDGLSSATLIDVAITRHRNGVRRLVCFGAFCSGICNLGGLST